MTSSRQAMRQAVTWFALVVAVAIAGNVALGIATHHVYTLPGFAPDHYDNAVAIRLPIPVVNQAYGGWLVIAVFWATAAGLAIAGLTFSRAFAGTSGSIKYLIAAQAAVLLVLSICPIMLSADSYAYVGWGRLYGVHGENPYVPMDRIDISSDSVLALITKYYGNPLPIDAYGPLWTLVAGLLARIEAGVSLGFQVWTHKLLAIVACIVAMLGLARATRKLAAPERLKRLGTFAFHPLVLLEAAMNGHNDMLMVAAAIWAFAIAEEFPLLSGLLVGAAIAVKYVALILLPFVAIRAGRTRLVNGVVLAIVAGIVVVLLFRPFWFGPGTISAVVGHEGLFGLSLTWMLNYPFFYYGVEHEPAFAALPTLPFFGVASWPRLIQLSVVAAFFIIALVSILRYARSPRMREIWRTISAMIWALSIMDPWYLVWLSPALAAGRRWATFAWWFCTLILLRYVLDVVARPQAPVPLLFAITIAYLAIPVAVALTRPKQAEAA
jgi:hypothetical protein